MRLGELPLANPVVLAPMAGVCNRPFRTLVKEQGCGLVVTEMVSARAISRNDMRTYQMLELDPGEHPVSIQMFGSEPDVMAEAAKRLVEAGADAVDINMGCPAPKIVGNGDGSSLMRDPARAAAIVEAVRKAVPVPVTVKMRAGWDERSRNAVEVAKAVEAAGAAAIAVHGRTRAQGYSGRSDWALIGEVQAAVSVPVIGNGDVQSPEDAERLLREAECAGVMIGRAALGNPWIFKQVAHFLETGEHLPDPGPAERIETALRHLDLLVEAKGERIGVREMRKHAAWYTKGLPGSNAGRDRLNQVEEREAMREILLGYRERLLAGEAGRLEERAVPAGAGALR